MERRMIPFLIGTCLFCLLLDCVTEISGKTEHRKISHASLNSVIPAADYDLSSVDETDATKCYCSSDNLCACCEYLEIPKINVNDTGCLELLYLPKDFGVSLIFEIDNHVLMNKTISARNPPPICYDVPDVEFATLCVQLFNLNFDDKLFTGCVRVMADLEGHEIYKRDIGCFKLPI